MIKHKDHILLRNISNLPPTGVVVVYKEVLASIIYSSVTLFQCIALSVLVRSVRAYLIMSSNI